MNSVSVNPPVSYSMVYNLAMQMPYEDRVRLGKEITKPTRTSKLRSLLDAMSDCPPVDDAVIVSECKKAREEVLRQNKLL